jgi:hypothetical protein
LVSRGEAFGIAEIPPYGAFLRAIKFSTGLKMGGLILRAE